MNGKEESRAEPQLGHFILRSVLYIIREGEGPVAKRRDLSSGQTEPGLREGRVRVGRAVGWSCGRGGNLSAEGEYEGIWGGGCSGAGCHSRKTPSILYFFFPTRLRLQFSPSGLGQRSARSAEPGADGRAGCSQPDATLGGSHLSLGSWGGGEPLPIPAGRARFSTADSASRAGRAEQSRAGLS